MWIIRKNFFLPDLNLGKRCVFLDEFDTQVKLAPFFATLEHVVNGSNNVAGLQVAATQAETGRVKIRNLPGVDRGQVFVGK